MIKMHVLKIVLFVISGLFAIASISEAQAMTPVCDRTTQVKNAIVKIVEKPCGEVAAMDMEAISDLAVYSLETLSLGDFDGLSGLNSLSLEGSQLMSIPSNIFDPLVSLKELSVDNIGALTLPSNLLNNLINLSTFRWANGFLAGLPKDFFNGPADLKEIWLTRNQISSFPVGILDNVPGLESLLLFGNQIPVMPEEMFKNLHQLNFLNIDFEATSPELLSKVAQIHFLTLMVQKMNFVPANFLSVLPNLKYLAIEVSSKAGSDSIAEDFLLNAPNLQFFGLEGGDFETLPERLLNRNEYLSQLFLRDNKLTFLPVLFFEGMFQNTQDSDYYPAVLLDDNKFSNEEVLRIKKELLGKVDLSI